MTRATRPETDLTSFGRWLMEQLQQRSMTRADLSRAVGSSSGNVSDWLYESNPSSERCHAIAAALMLPVDEVLTRAGHLQPPRSPESAIHQEAANLLARIPGALLVPVIPMLRGLAEQADNTIKRMNKAMDRD